MLLKDCEPDTAANVTVAVPPDYEWVDIGLYCVYAVQGLVTFVGGMAIAAAILKYPGLRAKKENLVVLALMVYPSFDSLAFLFASAYRIPVVLAGRAKVPTTMFFCWLMPFNQLWIMFGSPGVMALCAVSLDRLILTAKPMWYLGQGAGLGWGMFAACYIPGLLFYVVSGVQAYQKRDECSEKAKLICYGSMSREKSLHALQGTVLWQGALASLAIFAVAMVFYKSRAKQMVANAASSQQRDAQLKAQHKVTRSFALSTIYTLVLYVIPAACDTALGWYQHENPGCWQCSWVSVAIWITANFNPILNIYIFARHKEIRIGVNGVFKGKQLPYDVSTWDASTTG